MASTYRKRSGDRPDGRRIRSLNGFSNFIPFIMPHRNDALNYYAEAIDIGNAERWFRQQRADGYKGMGMLHLFIAAYVRCVAELPALNRFVVGRRIYSHNDIEVVMAIKRSLAIDATETTIKTVLDPADTVYDVYRKLNREIEEVKSSDDANSTEDFANKFAKLPRFVIRLAIALIRVADYFGWLSKDLIDLSPFHGSMIITDLGSLGIGPIYHHIYNIGTLPVFISFGAKRRVYELQRDGSVAEKKYVDAKFTVDERIVDGYYYATVFRLMSKYLNNPSLLEVPPESIKRDIF